MLVEIKKEVFVESELRDLKFLIQTLMYKKRYSLFVEYHEIKDCELYKKLDKQDKDDIEQMFNTSIQENFVQADYFVVVSSQGGSRNCFTLEEGIRFFNQPVSIILENSLNDSYFVLALIKHCDKSAQKKIVRHQENGWLLFDNGGGCTNIENFIEGKMQSFKVLSMKSGKNKSSYLRCFVLIDSDKNHPSMPMKKDKSDLEFYLKNNDIPFHFLEKREMENYIPDEVLAEYESKDKFIELYLGLSDNQKDYFDLHKGFAKNRSDRDYDKDILNHFRTVSDADWKILKNGIQLEPYAKSFKSEFPKLFEHEKVTQKTLLNRTTHQQQPNELQDILDKIRKLL